MWPSVWPGTASTSKAAPSTFDPLAPSSATSRAAIGLVARPVDARAGGLRQFGDAADVVAVVMGDLEWRAA